MSESSADRDTLVLERKPISVFLRERLTAAGRRAWANDNLSDFVGPIELDALENEVADRANEMLHALVIDTESDPNTRDTARRVARMFVREVFAGRYQPRPEVTEFEGIRQADECFAIGPIAIRSCCAHHLVPITGQAWVGVIPNVENATVIGLSKYHRLTQWIMSRPQIQEEAVEQLADELEGAIEAPRALTVVIRAKHLCCGWRGVKDDASLMTTSVMRGLFKQDPKARQEFLALLELRSMLQQAEAAKLKKQVRREPQALWTPLPGPQTEAINSRADHLFFGGGAGGKSDCLLGTALTQHQRSIIFRREFKQLEGLRERAEELYGDIGHWNGQKELWRLAYGGKHRRIEFGAVQLRVFVPPVGPERF